MKHVGNTPFDARLDAVGLEGVGRAHWNLPPAKLILQTLLRGEGVLTSSGALAIATGKFTGRSPKDRFLVKDASTADRVDWGDINQALSPDHFQTLLQDVQSHLNGRSVFVKDAAVGADKRYRIPVRVVAEKAWSSLFVDNTNAEEEGREGMENTHEQGFYSELTERRQSCSRRTSLPRRFWKHHRFSDVEGGHVVSVLVGVIQHGTAKGRGRCFSVRLKSCG